MKFDKKLHYTNSFAHFTSDGVNDIRDNPVPKIQTGFTAEEDLSMYDMTAGISARMETILENRTLRPQKITEQDASVSLTFNTTYSGYEKSPGQRDFATAGQSRDPEKMDAAGAISKALLKKFNAEGYACKLSGIDLKIHLTDRHNADPLAAISHIYEELKKIERDYEEGKNPLPDVTPPSGKVKLNPYDHPPTAEQMMDQWQKMTRPSPLAARIASIARDHFAGATDDELQQFRETLEKILPRERRER